MRDALVIMCLAVWALAVWSWATVEPMFQTEGPKFRTAVLATILLFVSFQVPA